jgi:hypothetical protein
MEEGYDRLKAHMRRIGRCYWIRQQETEADNGDIQEGLRQIETEVKIALSVSHNTLTRAEEYVLMKEYRLKVEITQRSLSDLGCGNHTEA